MEDGVNLSNHFASHKSIKGSMSLPPADRPYVSFDSAFAAPSVPELAPVPGMWENSVDAMIYRSVPLHLAPPPKVSHSAESQCARKK